MAGMGPRRAASPLGCVTSWQHNKAGMRHGMRRRRCGAEAAGPQPARAPANAAANRHPLQPTQPCRLGLANRLCREQD